MSARSLIYLTFRFFHLCGGYRVLLLGRTIQVQCGYNFQLLMVFRTRFGYWTCLETMRSARGVVGSARRSLSNRLSKLNVFLMAWLHVNAFPHATITRFPVCGYIASICD